MAGGGRYDNLVGMFDPKAVIPCVGVSIGIERLMAILYVQAEESGVLMRTNEVFFLGRLSSKISYIHEGKRALRVRGL